MLQECRCIRHPKFRIVVVFENQGLVQCCWKCHCYSTGCLRELISCSSWCDAQERWIWSAGVHGAQDLGGLRVLRISCGFGLQMSFSAMLGILRL
jgi:hypothetical protein